MAGRPEIYSPEIAVKICTEISTSTKSLRTICKGNNMPSVATVLKWLRDDTDGFLAQYTRAKEEQADYLVEEMIDISDDGRNDTIETDRGPLENKEWTSRSKLRVETRKWIASKLKPKKYSERVDITTDGDKLSTGTQLTSDQFAELIRQINANSNPG